MGFLDKYIDLDPEGLKDISEGRNRETLPIDDRVDLIRQGSKSLNENPEERRGYLARQAGLSAGLGAGAAAAGGYIPKGLSRGADILEAGMRVGREKSLARSLQEATNNLHDLRVQEKFVPPPMRGQTLKDITGELNDVADQSGGGRPEIKNRLLGLDGRHIEMYSYPPSSMKKPRQHQIGVRKVMESGDTDLQRGQIISETQFEKNRGKPGFKATTVNSRLPVSDVAWGRRGTLMNALTDRFKGDLKPGEFAETYEDYIRGPLGSTARTPYDLNTTDLDIQARANRSNNLIKAIENVKNRTTTEGLYFLDDVGDKGYKLEKRRKMSPVARKLKNIVTGASDEDLAQGSAENRLLRDRVNNSLTKAELASIPSKSEEGFRNFSNKMKNLDNKLKRPLTSLRTSVRGQPLEIPFPLSRRNAIGALGGLLAGGLGLYLGNKKLDEIKNNTDGKSNANLKKELLEKDRERYRDSSRSGEDLNLPHKAINKAKRGVRGATTMDPETSGFANLLASTPRDNEENLLRLIGQEEDKARKQTEKERLGLTDDQYAFLQEGP